MKAVSRTATFLLLIQSYLVLSEPEDYVEEAYLNNLDVDFSKPTYDQILYKRLHHQEVTYDLGLHTDESLERDKRQVQSKSLFRTLRLSVYLYVRVT